MTTLQAYRDDGPPAAWAGHRLRLPAALAPLLTIAGSAPLALVLLAASPRDVPWTAVPAALWFALVAGAGARGTAGGGLAWTVPPLLRLAEYGLLVGLTSVADPDAMPRCFALLGVLAFHHYDTVYRLGHQGVGPASWVRAAGGGWDGRLIAASVIATGGVLGVGLTVGAIALGGLYLAESVASWRGFVRGGARPAVYDDEDLEVA